MRPKERRGSGQKDLFRARLDQIVDMGHPLARLAGSVDWRFLEGKLGAVYSDKAGHPPLPTRLMAGLAILKHMHDLSDEALCDRWIENPYFQLFCGEEFFQHKLTFDRSSLTRWRQRMGEEKLVALVQESQPAIFYVLSTGCQWSALPKDLPPKSTAHDYFILLDRSGALQRMHEALYLAAREAAGREASPTAAIIDTDRQSRSKRGSGLDPQGYDAGKKVVGRKRHVLVDTLGLLLSVVIHPANVQDRDGAREVRRARPCYSLHASAAS